MMKTITYDLSFYWGFIDPATKLVIPAAAERRAGIQKRPCDYWIPASAGVTA